MELQLPRDNHAKSVQRKDPMTRVRIKSRTANQVIPGGYIIPQGESTCLIYTPDLPIIQAMVEPDMSVVDQARVFFEKSVENDIKDELKDINDAEGKTARLARARQEACGSVEGTFFFLHKRDVLPFESVEVLEGNIPAPVQQQSTEQQSFLAATIAREVAAALAAALPSIIAAAAAGTQSLGTQPQNKQR